MDKRFILVVEDSPDDQLLLETAIRDAGVQNPLKFFKKGEEAQTYLALCERSGKGLPVLIFLDLLLQDEDGLTFLRKLRKNPATHRIPVIVLSQSAQRQHLNESYQLGANSFVSKDGRLKEFNEKIQCLCDYWLRICQVPVA